MTPTVTDYFKKPSLIGIIADVNEGKSNLVYHLIEELTKKYVFNLVTFALKSDIEGATTIHSLEELEEVKDSLIFLDEFYSLFDLDNRQKKRQVERTLRLIHHNNNVLVLVGVPENFKKFISGKISICFYKKVKISDFINGSSVKKNLLDYQGEKRGTQILHLDKGEVLVFDGKYNILDVPYLEKFDSKLGNCIIFQGKSVSENMQKTIKKGL